MAKENEQKFFPTGENLFLTVLIIYALEIWRNWKRMEIRLKNNEIKHLGKIRKHGYNIDEAGISVRGGL